ncbi:DUF4397 domain-containing protein [Aquimarina sp. MMG015]|uniref:DUF4397 domain-containing protein n=1 Tax=Aquimarina sp. MMG015 TaxID=2822689 RepID=UPI001B3A0070|nr:DUF4397 domain-containing protein [Aquimarina sp. MMG015]MBQ4803002.1 DUF4397 domain-containing protein [Aquimarina sp. MMG015]
MKKSTYLFMFVFLLIGNYTIAQTARVQLIHNSPDLAAATVDIYVNGSIPDASLDNIMFRTASPFLTVPTDTALTIDITAPDAVDNSSPIFTKQLNLADGFTYILVADGIVSDTGYEPNIPFDVFSYAFGQESGLNGVSNTDIVLHHGGVDAPTEIDIIDGAAAPGAPAIFNSADYGTFVGRDNSETTNGRYKSLPSIDYVIKVTDEATVETIEAYDATLTDLEGVNLAGDAVVLVASGFLDPTVNSDGDDFGLFVFSALGGGGVGLEIPAVPKASVQLIHNSPDAGPVDVYVENVLTFEDVNFRVASPFFETFAKINLKIDVRPANATATSIPVLSEIVTLDENNDYIIVVDGLVNGSGASALNYEIYDLARQAANDNTKVDVLVHHGSPDTPSVDIFETAITNGAELVDNISYTDFDGYQTLDPTAYVLEIREEGTTNVLNESNADISGFIGQSITIIASGLLTPSSGNEDQALELYVFTSSGGAGIGLGNTLSVDEFNESNTRIWPNPVLSEVNIQIPFLYNKGTVQIFDIIGKQMISENLEKNTVNTVDVSQLGTGIYILQLNIDDKNLTTKIEIR